MLIGLIVVVVGLVLYLMVAYNGLVRLKVQCDNAWSDIDVQLKRRYDLIPNLVQTVQGYAAHEKGTLDAVVRDLKTKIVQFPSNIIAGMFNITPRQFFEISAPAERDVPKVSFGATT